MTKQTPTRRTMHNDGDVYEQRGVYHRSNGPALIWDREPLNGEWYLFGEEHRYYGDYHGLWYIHGYIVK